MALLPIFFLLSLMTALIYAAERVMIDYRALFYEAKKSHLAFEQLEAQALKLLHTSTCKIKIDSVNTPLAVLSQGRGCTKTMVNQARYHYALGEIAAELTPGETHQVIAIYAEKKPGTRLVLRYLSSGGVISRRYIVD